MHSDTAMVQVCGSGEHTPAAEGQTLHMASYARLMAKQTPNSLFPLAIETSVLLITCFHCSLKLCSPVTHFHSVFRNNHLPWVYLLSIFLDLGPFFLHPDPLFPHVSY